MQSQWVFIQDAMMLSVFLLIATIIKRRVKLFGKFLVPNSIIAGFIGLIAGNELLGIISFDTGRLGNIIYHLMAIGFISLALKERNREKSKDVTNTGIFIVSTYVMQAIIGFSISLILAYTLLPNLFPSFGLLLPLGYGQGPGQAYSIGSQWEEIGFLYGGNIGLSISTFGFIWACIGGIPLVNYLVRKNRKNRKNGIVDNSDSAAVVQVVSEKERPDDIPLSDSIDRITIQISLIGFVYLITYLTLLGLSSFLDNMGTMGQTISQLLWGFNFIIGAIYAIVLRIIFDKLKERNIMTRNYPNNFLLQRIAGGSFDFMVTASICAISISVLKYYLVPALIVTTVGGLATAGYVMVVCKKVYKKHTMENIVALFGMLTGNISTGLALLREIDPEFKSDTAKNLVLGSGVGLLLGFPLMIVLSVPITGYVENKPELNFIALGIFIVYLSILLLLLYLNREKRKSS